MRKNLADETKQHVLSEFLNGKSVAQIATQVQVALWQDITTSDIEDIIREHMVMLDSMAPF